MSKYKYISQNERENSQHTIPRRNSVHGLRNTRQYNIWQAMIQRCYNPNTKYYELYGGKGISVCEEWHDFKAFYDWAMAKGYDESLSIDRKDGNLNYDPFNCKWSTLKEQSNNTNRNVYITVEGQTMTMKQWSEKLNIKYQKLVYMNKTKKNIPEYISSIKNNA